MATVLIAEDEQAISLLIKYNLEKAGYKTVCAFRGDDVLPAVEKNNPSLILMDWMMPGLSGLELCKIIRGMPEYKNTPIIMLTAKSQEEDKIDGLSAGADDYVTKPFSLPELLARIKTNLRRAGDTDTAAKKEYKFRDILLKPAEKKVFRGQNYVQLAPTEFKILKMLISEPRRVFSRDEILHGVWGENVYVEARTVDVHMRRLRKALNEYGADYIRTIRSTGYSLDDHEAK